MRIFSRRKEENTEPNDKIEELHHEPTLSDTKNFYFAKGFFILLCISLFIFFTLISLIGTNILNFSIYVAIELILCIFIINIILIIMIKTFIQDKRN